MPVARAASRTALANDTKEHARKAGGHRSSAFQPHRFCGRGKREGELPRFPLDNFVKHVMYMHESAYERINVTIDLGYVGDCACHKVRMAARAVTRAYDDALRPARLRASQLAVLVAIINNDGAISITALAEVMGMDRSTLTRNLRPLEKEALVTVGLEGWRRSRPLQITKKGQSRLTEALPLWQRAQDSLRCNLGERSWLHIHESLDRLILAA